MSGWIRTAEKPPRKEDADAEGCVLVWHDYSGCMCYRWEAVALNGFMRWWMPCPARPEE